MVTKGGTIDRGVGDEPSDVGWPKFMSKILIVDYKTVPTNALGGCHLRILQGLSHQHEFTVLAVEFENPFPERIEWIRIPAPTRPLVLLFVAYHLFATMYYWTHRLCGRARYDSVQSVDTNFAFVDVSYSQFCHRAYLRHHWKQSKPKGSRGWLRWLDHWLHALLEPWVYRRVKRIVVPSQGLSRELIAEYPYTREKIRIIPNCVELERMRMPSDFDREGFRKNLGADPEDLVLVFVALGHFERKGLPLLLEALRRLSDPRLKLLVVGGQPDLLAAYRSRVEELGLKGKLVFVGMQRDVRPYLWAADAFAFPSFYETFSLVSFEAAAARLPLIVAPLHGVEEFLRDGENGILVERTPEGVAEGIARFLTLSPEARRSMGEKARRDVEGYAPENFVAAWRALYEEKHANLMG